ncbi:RpiB/LacA/LacB family sugar-phosphate isomerase [Patescibacteria group bacterium]|nr:RpiB/LacA/LacB family sugar-phosphate isomerase [Patescibacteria group bacterium]
MKVYLGADHGGFKLKETVKQWLNQQKIECEDLGNTIYDPVDDFVDFGVKVAEKVQKGSGKGILFCRAGGMALVANKFKGVEAVEVWNLATARHAKEHRDANVLGIPADYVDEKLVCAMIKLWLEAKVRPEKKYQRRIDKIKQIEERNFV